MRPRIVWLTLITILSLTTPVLADGLYDNGPVNGQVDAWVINFGYAVTDSIQISGVAIGLDFWAWLIPGDTISNVQISIGSSPFGSDIFNGFANLTQSHCTTNAFGYDVCLESTGYLFSGWWSGTAWLTLQNANVPSGDPVYWDENSGVGCQSNGCPSMAQENSLGTIPSEAFTIEGGCDENSPGCGPPPSPEPGTLVLFGSGVVGLAAMFARRRRS